MNDVFIVAAKRTPIGDFQGSLSALSAVELGTVAVKSVVDEAGLAYGDVTEIVGGMIYKAGAKGNPARQIQLAAGFEPSGIACTIDQQCGSGMRALEVLSQQILLGKTDIGIAVGMESMSNAPYILHKARTGLRMGDAPIQDCLTLDGLNCAIMNYHMGVTAENLAGKYGISRQEQDELACLSHERALKAQERDVFAEETVPVPIKDKRGNTVTVNKDEHPRAVTMESLGQLKPAFKKDGTVTAGNASSINDGAAALLLMSEAAIAKTGAKPLAKILSTASFGVPPEVMGIGPVYALPRALQLADLTLQDIDYFEINEAFAAQFLACQRELKLDMERVNANGSGIGLGHPVGATGARIVVSLLYELKRRGGRYGAATLCVGGGPVIATVIEML